MTEKKILIVTSEFPPQPGGIGNHAYHLALYLSKSNFTVSVIADQRAEDNSEENHFDSKLPFRVIRINLRQWRFPMYINRVVRTFKHIRQSDFVIATGKFSLWNVGFCRQFLKFSSMAVIHGSEVNFKAFGLRLATDLALKQFNNIVAVSKFTKDLVSSLNLKIEVIPNGIVMEKWELPSFTNLDLKGDPVLTTVGRVSARKGQLQVIKILPELIKVHPNLHYHCIGIPTEAAKFRKESKRLNVDSYITFHGAVSETHLKQILCKSDIFVMLSTESKSGDVEGFGIAILEANAMGIPAIGSKGCGIEDAIENGISGLLVDSDNSENFKKAIDKILINKKTFNKNAIEWANSHDWHKIVKQYINLIS